MPVQRQVRDGAAAPSSRGQQTRSGQRKPGTRMRQPIPAAFPQEAAGQVPQEEEQVW